MREVWWTGGTGVVDQASRHHPPGPRLPLHDPPGPRLSPLHPFLSSHPPRTHFPGFPVDVALVSARAGAEATATGSPSPSSGPSAPPGVRAAGVGGAGSAGGASLIAVACAAAVGGTVAAGFAVVRRCWAAQGAGSGRPGSASMRKALNRPSTTSGGGDEASDGSGVGGGEGFHGGTEPNAPNRTLPNAAAHPADPAVERVLDAVRSTAASRAAAMAGAGLAPGDVVAGRYAVVTRLGRRVFAARQVAGVGDGAVMDAEEGRGGEEQVRGGGFGRGRGQRCVACLPQNTAHPSKNPPTHSSGHSQAIHPHPGVRRRPGGQAHGRPCPRRRPRHSHCRCPAGRPGRHARRASLPGHDPGRPHPARLAGGRRAGRWHRRCCGRERKWSALHRGLRGRLRGGSARPRGCASVCIGNIVLGFGRGWLLVSGAAGWQAERAQPAWMQALPPPPLHLTPPEHPTPPSPACWSPGTLPTIPPPAAGC